MLRAAFRLLQWGFVCCAWGMCCAQGEVISTGVDAITTRPQKINGAVFPYLIPAQHAGDRHAFSKTSDAPVSETIRAFLDADGQIKPDAPFIRRINFPRAPRNRVAVTSHSMFLDYSTTDPAIAQCRAALMPKRQPGAEKKRRPIAQNSLNLPAMARMRGQQLLIVDPATNQIRKRMKFVEAENDGGGKTSILLNENLESTMSLKQAMAALEKTGEEGASLSDWGFSCLEISRQHPDWMTLRHDGYEESWCEVILKNGAIRELPLDGEEAAFPKFVAGQSGFFIKKADRLLFYDEQGTTVAVEQLEGRSGQVILDQQAKRGFFWQGSASLRRYEMKGNRPYLKWRHDAQEWFADVTPDAGEDAAQFNYDTPIVFSSDQQKILLAASRRSPHPHGERVVRRQLCVDRDGRILINRLKVDWIRTSPRLFGERRKTSIYRFWDATTYHGFCGPDRLLCDEADPWGKTMLEQGKYVVHFIDIKSGWETGRFVSQLPPRAAGFIGCFLFSPNLLEITQFKKTREKFQPNGLELAIIKFEE